MATVRITDANGAVLREYDVPPTERIELNPGERVVFVDASIEDVSLDNLGDVDVAVTIENFTVVLGRFFAFLEEGADVELLFSEAFEDGRDPFDASGLAGDRPDSSSFDIGRIATLDALISTAAGGQENGQQATPTNDDGLGNDGRVTVGDLFPDHLRAVGIEGEIPTVAFESPEVEQVVFEQEEEPAPEANDTPTAVRDPDPESEEGCVEETTGRFGGDFYQSEGEGGSAFFIPASTAGNILDNDDFGGDGRGAPPITQIVYDGTTYTDDDSDGVIVIVSGDGTWTLTVYVQDTGPNSAGDYVFELHQPFEHSGEGADTAYLEFPYTIVDGNGDTDSAPLTICIHDDIPVALDDTDSVDEGEGNSVSGNVVLGFSTNGIGAMDDEGADGASVTAVGGGSIAGPIAGTYGTLTMDANGNYTYTLDVDTVPPGETDVFEYTLTDGDGDTDTATLTISFNDANEPFAEPTSNTVEESDLPEGTTPLEDGETASGSLNFGSIDPATLSVEGSDINSPTDIAGAHGTLTVNPDGSYSYTLSGPVDHSGGPVTDLFSYSVTDDDGDVATETLTINIVDDVPNAEDDTDNVDEGEGNTASGNVVTGTSQNGAGGPDTEGADGASVTLVDGTPIAGPTDIAGTYGTLSIDATGAYTYTLNVDTVPPGATEVFGYTLTDADGDADTATLTISFNDNNEPFANPATNSVEESDLPEGTTPLEDGETAAGSLDFGSVDPATLSVEGGDINAPTDIAGDHGTLTINPDGSYSYTLSGPVDHSGGPVTDVFSYSVTDEDGDVATSTLTIDIEDDDPTAASFEFTTEEPKINLVLIVDVSGSMDDVVDLPGGGTATRIDLLKSALDKLLEAYGDLPTRVEVTFVPFASGPSLGFSTSDTDGAFATVTMSLQEAVAYVQTLETGMENGVSDANLGPGTEYDDAVNVAQAAIEANLPTDDTTETVVYFLSDGEPDPAANVAPAQWKTFADDNDIQVVAVGFGGDVSPTDSDLEGVSDNVIIIDDDDLLPQALLDTIPTPQGAVVEVNVLTDVPTSGPSTDFGADGPEGGTPHVSSVTLGAGTPDEIIYTYDPDTGTITPSVGAPFAGPTMTVSTPLGGELSVDFSTGDFRYAAPPVDGDDSETLDYTITDGDGDVASGAIVVTIEDDNTAPTVQNHTVWVPDDISAASLENNSGTGYAAVSSTFGFALLLAMPMDPETDVVTVTIDPLPGGFNGTLYYDNDPSAAVNYVAVVPGVALTAEEFASLRYLPNSPSGTEETDSFTYTANDGFLTSTSATVTINTVSEEVGGGVQVLGVTTETNTIWGTDVADELTGGDMDDSILGGEGDDTLDGGLGSDVLEGGSGNDTLFSGLDNDAGDKLFGGDGDDRLVLQEIIDFTGDKLNMFQIADGGNGIDVLDIGNDQDATGIGHLDLGTAILSGSGTQVSKLHSIEIIDMTDGDGLDRVGDIRTESVDALGADNDLEGMAFFTDADVLETTPLDIDLIIRGDAGPGDDDQVDFDGAGWSNIGTITDPFNDGGTIVYDLYQNGDSLVAVQTGLDVLL